MTDEARFDIDRNITTIANSRIVFHCHHYNVFLQRTIDEALGPDAIQVQCNAAAESTRRMLSELFASDGGAPFRARLERAAALFGSLGFGKAEVSSLTDQGGTVILRTSHYAIGWRAKFGAPSQPVCHFATGYWAGALAAATNIAPERILARESRCAALHEHENHPCEIVIEVL